MNDIRILLVDDHVMLRQGLRLLLAQEPGFSVVGEEGEGNAAFETALAARPDVVVMDIELLGANGIDTSRRIMARLPETKILILSALANDALLDDALAAGIRGYLLKENAADELIRAIRAVCAGNTYFSPEVGTMMVAAYRRVREGPGPEARPALSERELAVLELMADGLRNKEIAERLCVSTKTVETHRHRLMGKLKCASPGELIRCAVRKGLLEA